MPLSLVSLPAQTRCIMRYFLELSYHGAAFCGWQRQDNALSVQEVLEENLSKLFAETIAVTGCGRTDTGVHAHRYFAHIDTEKEEPENFLYRINRMLPDGIAIQRIFPVAPNLHARFDASDRTYKYFVHTDKNPFLEDRSFHIHRWRPDVEQMNACIRQLLGERDFSTFEKKGSDNKTSVCLLKEAYWESTEHGWVFTITANRFLRNMVRRITAALLEVGLGRMDADTLLEAVRQQQPLEVKLAVPAKGLFLWDIRYDFNKQETND